MCRAEITCFKVKVTFNNVISPLWEPQSACSMCEIQQQPHKKDLHPPTSDLPIKNEGEAMSQPSCSDTRYTTLKQVSSACQMHTCIHRTVGKHLVEAGWPASRNRWWISQCLYRPRWGVAFCPLMVAWQREREKTDQPGGGLQGGDRFNHPRFVQCLSNWKKEGKNAKGVRGQAPFTC